MIIKASELFEKEVVSITDGTRLGEISDLEINTSTAQVESVTVCHRPYIFGLFGKGGRAVIPTACIKVYGDDIILADYETPPQFRYKRRRRTKLLGGIFE